MSLTNFWSNLNKYSDIARANRFDVLINPPKTLAGRDVGGLFSAEATELPGKSLNVFERKDYVITEKMPMQTLYSEINITFLLWSNERNSIDTGLPQKRFFDDWIQSINFSPTDSSVGNAAYNFNYKNEYASTIEIRNYDVTGYGTSSPGSISHKIVLVDAYPIAVGSVGLNWAEDGIMRLPVTFAYTRWYRDGINRLPYSSKNPAPSPSTITETNLMTGMMKIGQATRPGEPGFDPNFTTQIFPPR